MVDHSVRVDMLSPIFSVLNYASAMIPQDAKDRLEEACNFAMGPTDEITPSAPTRNSDGEYTGGLAIERGDGRCDPVKPGTRCYTIANSYQTQRGTWAPAAASKVNGSFDENNLMRRKLNIVRPDMFST